MGVTIFWITVFSAVVIPIWTKHLENRIEDLDAQLKIENVKNFDFRKRVVELEEHLHIANEERDDFARENEYIKLGNLFLGDNILPVGYRQIRIGDSQNKLETSLADKIVERNDFGFVIEINNSLIDEILYRFHDGKVSMIRFRFRSDNYQEYILSSLFDSFGVELVKKWIHIQTLLATTGKLKISTLHFCTVSIV